MLTSVLGLDLGGSRSRALVLGEDARVVAEAMGGPGNLAVFGERDVARTLEQLIEQVSPHLGAGPAACCCGAAGAEDDVAHGQLRGILEQLLPGSRIKVVPDPVLVLAAAGIEEGVALIAGTGSIAYGVARGAVVRAGGWGPRLGDEGGGYWAVRDAVREILRAHDAGRALDQVQLELLDRAGAANPIELMHLFHREPASSRWAALAPLALRDGVRLERAAAALADLAETVRARLGSGVPVVLAGGVLLNTPGLEEMVRGRLSGEVVRLAAEPVLGAALIARTLLTTQV